MATFGMCARTRAIASPWRSVERRVVGCVGNVCEPVSHVRDQPLPKRFVFFVRPHDVHLRGVSNEPGSAPDLFLKLRWRPSTVTDEKPDFMGLEAALLEHVLDLFKVATHVNAIDDGDAVRDVFSGVQIVEVPVLDGASNADAGVQFGQFIHHLVHIDVHEIVQHKTKAAFFVVLAKQNDFSPEVRVVEEGLAEQNVSRFGQGLIAGCETDHRQHEVRSVLRKIEALRQSSVICNHERLETLLDGSVVDGLHWLWTKRVARSKDDGTVKMVCRQLVEQQPHSDLGRCH